MAPLNRADSLIYVDMSNSIFFENVTSTLKKMNCTHLFWRDIRNVEITKECNYISKRPDRTPISCLRDAHNVDFIRKNYILYDMFQLSLV
jgi:hypothetical protein